MSTQGQSRQNPLAGLPTRWDAVVPALERVFHKLAVANLQGAMLYQVISPEEVKAFFDELQWLTFTTDEAGREWMQCPRCLDRMRVSKHDVIDRFINHTQVTLCKACGPWETPARGCGLTPRQQFKRGATDGG